jgi:hypothetical protein
MQAIARFPSGRAIAGICELCRVALPVSSSPFGSVGWCMPNHLLDTVEGKRLANREDWLRWGPYLAERQWGTVREDYSAGGDPWTYFPFDHARGRAYRWGEDGIAGFSDDRLRWCLSLALWNGNDSILKERMFGLTNAQGNHGEDVKELYYYLDSTPTHSYMRMLYKYPQAAFPYETLIAENARRGRDQPEYELLDTGIFNDRRYFDVAVEYAKASQGGGAACAAAALGAQHLGLAAGNPGAEAASGRWRRPRLAQPHAGSPPRYRYVCGVAVLPQ